MSEQDLNNFFRPAKELIKRLKHPHSPTISKNNTHENLLKNSLVHPLILKNANRNQRQKLNKSIEDLSKVLEKESAKYPLKQVFDREFLYHENISLKNLLKKKDLRIDELTVSNLKMEV